MVKVGEHKTDWPTVESDGQLNALCLFSNPSLNTLFVQVKAREYTRVEVQEFVAELVEWLAETAPKTEAK